MSVTSNPPPDQETATHARRVLVADLARFQTPSLARSAAQLATTTLAYGGIVALMYASWNISVFLTLALAVPAAGLLVRLFIIQHDCGHASYLRSRRANHVLGWLCSVFTFTPYELWRRQHAGHHAVWNNLDDRHRGADIYSACLTVEEYLALPPLRRFLRRIFRHPIVANLILPPLVFLVLYRIPFDAPRDWRKERRGVHLTNFAIAALLAGFVTVLGFAPVLVVQLSIMVPASIIGVWLFSVQHRFESSCWWTEADWTPAQAAIHGSSYLKLPAILQWFTGNIGFHHVHHLMPRVANYRLQACHEALQRTIGGVTILTLRKALIAPSYALWDPERRRMARFPR
jgi:acyl-lipid omega-6 desaturase (Delta-12 desaturase)